MTSAAANAAFNRRVALQLRECGELLRQQDANPFRVNAFLRAARTLDELNVDVRDIIRKKGHEGLIDLPAIGEGLASAIEEIAHTGRLTRLERLRGDTEPETILQTVPGIGPALSHIIHEELHIDSLEALEVAAYDGRLEALPGIGPRRLAAIRASLASLLQRRSRIAARPVRNGPPIGLILDVDAEYRRRADRLPKLAPRRFNPEHKAWLPILHTQRGDWHFTALFSNTARAHRFGRTHDWVVIYFYDDDHREGQHTVVTETYGAMRERRIVRGRETECAAYYDQLTA